MPLSLHEQALELLGRAVRPVIVLPRGGGPDGFACAFALARSLRQLDKPVDIVSADGEVPKSLTFLSPPERVRPTFGQLRKCVVSVDVSKAPLDELSYDVEDGTLKIYLTPRDGFWSEQDISVKTSSYRYDAIVTFGVASLETLGDLYQKHNEFFYETPLLNIDHSASNESFGHINVVDVTAVSCSEVLMELLGVWNEVTMNASMATDLLTGMIAKTQSFKTQNVTPKTLKHAGALLRQGARREEIVDNLYRTRTVETLRLWGRALARLKSDEQARMVWSLLSQQDFLLAGAGEEDLPDVIDELIRNAPTADLIVLLYEDKERHICGLISSDRGLDSVALALPFKPVGTRKLARICFTDKTIVEAEQAVIPLLKQRMGKKE